MISSVTISACQMYLLINLRVDGEAVEENSSLIGETF